MGSQRVRHDLATQQQPPPRDTQNSPKNSPKNSLELKTSGAYLGLAATSTPQVCSTSAQTRDSGPSLAPIHEWDVKEISRLTEELTHRGAQLPAATQATASATPGFWVLITCPSSRGPARSRFLLFSAPSHVLFSLPSGTLPFAGATKALLPPRPQGLTSFFCCSSEYFSKSRSLPSWEMFCNLVLRWLNAVHQPQHLLFKYSFLIAGKGWPKVTFVPFSFYFTVSSGKPQIRQANDGLDVEKCRVRNQNHDSSRLVWRGGGGRPSWLSFSS